MTSKRNIEKPKLINVGWICGICGKRDYSYPKQKENSATRILKHIMNKHPENYEKENWFMTPIKGEQ